MAQTCTKCSRANPSDAVYCYYDGMVLNGHGRAGGPVAVGSQAFANPFVFPSGKVCRSFNELALACQDDWSAAKDLLQQGYLGNFLGGLGRIDLAMAAKQSAQFPDPDRGLDDLLGKLPVDVLQPARLSLEAKEINLGVLPVGTTGRKVELKMENVGGRLLYGTASCPDGWLTFGDQPGITQKNIEFTNDYTLPVKVVGDRLRASNKPIETRITLDTSGGTKVVVVRVEVPVKVFPPGVLGGSKSPRQVAEKAKANPKEAAALFERGEVRAWYKDNGWTYPVQGPDASGIGAVQQFFEALGLTPAPKVNVNQRSISLSGNAGAQLRHTVEVKTDEKRPVYAHGSSDEPWLEIGRPILNGRMATIPLAVPSIPNKPGQTLTAKLTVQANGNQKFIIPVTLQVGGMLMGTPIPVPVVPVVVAMPVLAVPIPEAGFNDFAAPTAPMAASPAVSRRSRQPVSAATRFQHLIPAILLLLAVLGVVLVDVIRDKPSAQARTDTTPPPAVKPVDKGHEKPDDKEFERIDPNPKPGVKGPMGWVFNIRDPKPKLAIGYSKDSMRFGLLMPEVPDPRPEYKGKFKKLTYWEDGANNNTIIKVGGFEHYFGREVRKINVWGGKDGERKKIDLPPGRHGFISEMDYTRDKVLVTQHVEIVPNKNGVLDTCLVYYKVKNYNTFKQTVGLRVMLDTFIGTNDGVPFMIPGRRGFLTTKEIFPQKDMPDYVEVVEKPDDDKDLGTVVQLNLKGLRLPDIQLEDLEKMVICRWPRNKDMRWEWDYEAMDADPDNKDSCVVLYWGELPMNPDEERHMAFTYGLGKLDVVQSGEDAKPDDSPMALSVPSASIVPTGEFYVTSYLWKTKPGQKVYIEFPDGGLKLADGESLEKTVPEFGPQRVAVSWKVKAPAKTGTYNVQATSGNSRTKPKPVDVRPKDAAPEPGKTPSIFG